MPGGRSRVLKQTLHRILHALWVWSHAHTRYLGIPVYVEAVVLAGQDHRAIIHEGHIEALSVLNLALQGVDELTLLGEDGQVKVVVIVSDQNVPLAVDADTNGVIRDAFATNLSQENTLVVKHLHTVGTVVTDEDFFFVVNDDTVGEFKVLGTAKLVQDVSILVKYDHPHNLALDDYNPTLVVDGDSSGVLENVGAKLSDKLAVLIVDLDLVCGASLRHNDVTRRLHNSHSVWIQQLSISLPAFPKLELEAALFVKDLNAMIVGVGHNNIILSIDGDSAWLRELALHDAKLSKLAVVDHFLTLDLRLGRVEARQIHLG